MCSASTVGNLKVRDNLGALPQGTQDQFAADVDLGNVAVFAFPGYGRVWPALGVVDDLNRAGVGGHNLEDELKQSLLQRLEVALGIDGVSDLEERVQIAGHAANVGYQRRQGRRRLAEDRSRKWGHRFVPARLVILSRSASAAISKDQFAFPDRKCIAIFQDSLSDRHTVDEGALAAFEIGDGDRIAVAGDEAVGTRDRGVVNAQFIRWVTTNGYTFSRDRKDHALEWTGNGFKSRIHFGAQRNSYCKNRASALYLTFQIVYRRKRVPILNFSAYPFG